MSEAARNRKGERAFIDRILPPISRFGGGRAEKKNRVIDRLLASSRRTAGCD